MGKELNTETVTYIKNEVADIFQRYDITGMPISGVELAMKMGIQLIPYSGLNIETRQAVFQISQKGFYFEPGDGRECIYYNDAQEYEEINMTILRALGNCVLGHSDSTDSEIAEAEAELFAVSTLSSMGHRI